jgi:hypothetical protein
MSYYITMSVLTVLNTIPYLEEYGANWATFIPCFQEAMLATCRWGYFNGTTLRPTPRDPARPAANEIEAMDEWEHEDATAQYLLSVRLPDAFMLCIDDYPTAKAQWDQFIKELCQLGHKSTRIEEELTYESPIATGRGSSRRRRHMGKHHACREEGHSTCDCHVPKEEPMAVLAAEEPLGAAEQPETSPMDAIHTADFEGEGCLSQVLTQNLHMQTIGTKQSAISGEPGAIGFGQPGDPNVKRVAHAEPDSM